MDVQYLFFFPFLLLLAIYTGKQYVSHMKEARISNFLKINVTEVGKVLYSRFQECMGKEKIHAYDKYAMWRYVEHRKEASFIYESLY